GATRAVGASRLAVAAYSPQQRQNGWPAGSAYTWTPDGAVRSLCSSGTAPRATASSCAAAMSSTVMSRCTCWGCPSGHSGRTWSGASCTSMTCSPSTEIVCQSSSTSTVPPSRPAQKALTSSVFAASRAGIMLGPRTTATLGEDPDGPVPGWRGGVGVRRGASGGGAHALGLAAGLELGGLLRL